MDLYTFHNGSKKLYCHCIENTILYYVVTYNNFNQNLHSWEHQKMHVYYKLVISVCFNEILV